MSCAWLLTLLPPLLLTQVIPDSTSGNTTEMESNPTGWLYNGTGPSESPSGSPPLEDWTAAETFLYSGDSAMLETRECSRAYSPPERSGPLPWSFYQPLQPSIDALVSTANFLNMIFQASDLRESSVREDLEWYHALVRALLEAQPLIRRALFTFDADPTAPVPQLVLRASRNSAPKVQTILLQDLTSEWQRLHPPPPAPDDSWFSSFKFPLANKPLATPLSKRLLLNDLNTLDTPKWGQGDSYVTNQSGVRWADAPFLECEDGHFLPGWLLTLSTSFYGLKPDLTPEFRGVIRVDVNIQDFDIDQCATGDGWFSNTHQCNRTTMKCEPIPEQGFRLGQYCCRCKEGFYSHPLDSRDTGEDLPLNETDGVRGEMGGAACYPALPVCLPCWPGCRQCQDGSPCWVQEDWFLRAGVLTVQGLFMLLVFISMLVAYQHRRSRRIRASGLLLLETILFGSLLLYFPVFILYFKPSTFRCILLRWVRLLGFAIVYGTVTLKMYRVWRVFLSRTAQRVPYMSSLHLLRMLGVIVGTVSWFLCAWTVGVLQNRERNVPLLITSITSDGQGFSLCDLDRWDYMMAVAELLFLCWGSFLCSAVKPVPSAFHEPRYMGIAIHNELLLSSTFHLLRFILPSLHPDWMLMLFFTHTHVTITVTLALLFIPKFLHVSRPGREEIAAEVYEDEVDLRRSGSYLNSSFHSAWSDHSLDPDDIRDELKKLYAQLEVHKTKKMTTNNPHLQKKRSSRRGLGRSIIKRISEIPESMSRQCSREDKDIFTAGRNVDQSKNFKEIPDTRSVNHKNDSVKLPSPVLRKSQSEHDCVRDKDPSLHDSMMRANMAKRASRQSDTDSLDIAPLICKSASAQNLTMDNNLLHPDRKLHKSQSLSSPRPQVVGADQVNTSSSVKTQSLKMRSGLDITIKDQTTSALQSHSFDKAEICPWEMEVERPTDKSQKHVTYAPSQSDEPMSPDSLPSPLVHVCPWDHVPAPAPVAETNLEADCESPKPQAHISASVPNTPKAPKDQRVFSFRTSTQRWLSVKGFIGSVDESVKEKAKREMDGKLKKEDSISENKQESGDSKSLGTQSRPTSRNPSLEKKLMQKRRAMTVESKPCLVKQNAVRMSSGDSSDRSPRRLLIVKSTVYPCDAEDKQKDSMYENVFVSRQNSARSNTSCWEAGSSISSRTPSMHRRGSIKMTPTLSSSHADVCPWDVPDSSKQGLQKQQSTKADICPWEVEDTRLFEKASVGHWQSQEEDILKRQASIHTNVCPWESQDSPTTSNTPMSIELLQKQGPLGQKATDICPWDAVQNLEPSKIQESRAGVCPWEVQEPRVGPTHIEVIYENVNPTETTGLVKEPIQQKDVRPNVCPWESEDIATEGGKYKIDKSPDILTDQQLAKTMIATAASCPWEFPEPLNSVTDICPPEENPKALVIEKIKDSSLQEATTIKLNIGPWESREQERHDNKMVADVCPWETGDTGTMIQKDSNAEMGSNITETILINNKPNINICPWEREELENIEPQDNTKTATSKTIQEISKQDSAQMDVSPLETESLQTKQEDNGTRENVCPWETEEPEKTETDFINHTDVFKELENTKRQDSAQDVCPWETTDQETSKRKASLQADVCPWETANQETSQRKASLQADVCPWETTDQDTSHRKASIQADVCPWETTDQDTSQRKASIQADVCPWETTGQETSQRKANIQADVCPWETTGQETSKRKASLPTDVCPWETADHVTSKRKASLQVDVCPWETTEQASSKAQASIQADTCPRKSEGPERSTESSVHLSSCGIDEVTESQGELSNEIALMPPIDMNPNMPLARRDALCPWDMEQDSGSDVFTWEPENIPEEEEEEEGDAESAAEAFLFPSDL